MFTSHFQSHKKPFDGSGVTGFFNKYCNAPFVLSLSKHLSIIAGILLALSPALSSAAGRLECLIEPHEVIELSSQVPGIIDTITVERGDIVEKGQQVAKLKSAVEAASVELAGARVDFGKRKVVRNEELFQKQLISSHEKDEMETELKVYELQLREEEERLKLRTIESPIDGIIMERFLGPGESTGEKPVLKIARIDPLNVEVIVPVSRYKTIKKGMVAEVRPELPVGGKYRGKVVIVDQVIDAASGTFGVRVELPNPKYKLPAGLKCSVRFLKK